MQWGAWASVGMAAQSTTVVARIERSGMGVIKPAAGLELLRSMLTSSVHSAPQASNSCHKPDMVSITSHERHRMTAAAILHEHLAFHCSSMY